MNKKINLIGIVIIILVALIGCNNSETTSTVEPKNDVTNEIETIDPRQNSKYTEEQAKQRVASQYTGLASLQVSSDAAGIGHKFTPNKQEWKNDWIYTIKVLTNGPDGKHLWENEHFFNSVTGEIINGKIERKISEDEETIVSSAPKNLNYSYEDGIAQIRAIISDNTYPLSLMSEGMGRDVAPDVKEMENDYVYWYKAAYINKNGDSSIMDQYFFDTESGAIYSWNENRFLNTGIGGNYGYVADSEDSSDVESKKAIKKLYEKIVNENKPISIGEIMNQEMDILGGISYANSPTDIIGAIKIITYALSTGNRDVFSAMSLEGPYAIVNELDSLSHNFKGIKAQDYKILNIQQNDKSVTVTMSDINNDTNFTLKFIIIGNRYFIN